MKGQWRIGCLEKWAPLSPIARSHFPLSTSHFLHLCFWSASTEIFWSNDEKYWWMAIKKLLLFAHKFPSNRFYFDRRRAPIFFGISSKTMDIKLSIVFVSSFTLGQKIAAMDIQFAITITLVEALMYSLYSSTSFQNKRLINLWTRFVQKFIHPKFELSARSLSMELKSLKRW